APRRDPQRAWLPPRGRLDSPRRPRRDRPPRGRGGRAATRNVVTFGAPSFEGRPRGRRLYVLGCLLPAADLDPADHALDLRAGGHLPPPRHAWRVEGALGRLRRLRAVARHVHLPALAAPDGRRARRLRQRHGETSPPRLVEGVRSDDPELVPSDHGLEARVDAE